MTTFECLALLNVLLATANAVLHWRMRTRALGALWGLIALLWTYLLVASLYR